MVEEGELLAEVASVSRGALPECADRAEIARRSDQRDADRVTAGGGRRDRCLELPLGRRREGCVPRDEGVLCREDVTCRIPVGARARCRNTEQREQQRSGQRQAQPRESIAALAVRAEHNQ